MKTPHCLVILSLGLFMLTAGPVSGGQEPRGLLLRKGLLTWQATVNDARRFIEENIHPNIPTLIRGQKQAGFGCELQGGPGVTRCTWACCVDLGEKDVVHFATLWFFNDHFYAYDVAFNINQYSRLHSTLTSQFGPPASETQQTQINPAMALEGISTYVVNTKRWEPGKAVVLLSDRGGNGSPLVGHIYVTYLPLTREASPLQSRRASPARNCHSE